MLALRSLLALSSPFVLRSPLARRPSPLGSRHSPLALHPSPLAFRRLLSLIVAQTQKQHAHPWLPRHSLLMNPSSQAMGMLMRGPQMLVLGLPPLACRRVRTLWLVELSNGVVENDWCAVWYQLHPSCVLAIWNYPDFHLRH